MAVWTCGRGGERCTVEKVLRVSGEVEALVCPVHGLIANLGYKPDGGTAGVRAPDFSPTLAPAEYALLATQPPRWHARPPRGDVFILGVPATASPIATGPLTVEGFIDAANWRGWLEDGIWIEEER